MLCQCECVPLSEQFERGSCTQAIPSWQNRIEQFCELDVDLFSYLSAEWSPGSRSCSQRQLLELPLGLHLASLMSLRTISRHSTGLRRSPRKSAVALSGAPAPPPAQAGVVKGTPIRGTPTRENACALCGEEPFLRMPCANKLNGSLH